MLVLVVEDEPMIAASIEWELLDAGYDVLGPASSVAEAERLAAEHRPDLALVDINLAGHDEGVALARDLKARLGVPSVFVTGQLAQARQASDAALGVLTKPFHFDALVETVPVAAALARGRRPARLPRGLEVFGDWTSDRTLAAAG
ncbi:response regulator [Phenylobacterium sp.]|uniref:response regulator n=1 Tax=Phenylobacterium sp. TaxID=1871053 RepID=UPI002F93952B